MLEKNRCVFNISIESYLSDVINFISTRMSPHEYTESVTIYTKKKNGKQVVSSVHVHIKDRKFDKHEYSEYSVKIVENIRPLSDRKIFTQKYTYELSNDKNEKDLVRFDYYPYIAYPHLHINADPDVWGNHLVYPESTNLDLEKMDCFKALNIFQRFVTHPDNHILDQSSNEQYISILNGG